MLSQIYTELENIHGKQRRLLAWSCSFTVHTVAGLIVPEIQEEGKVKVDTGEPIVKASDVPTKLTPNKDQSAVKAEVEVCEVSLSVPCNCDTLQGMQCSLLAWEIHTVSLSVQNHARIYTSRCTKFIRNWP